MFARERKEKEENENVKFYIGAQIITPRVLELEVSNKSPNFII